MLVIAHPSAWIRRNRQMAGWIGHHERMAAR
jgi:hypothetical protein